ncbi:DUF4352 domain-containing protein [Paenibacillus ferrarius]|uniref:DUF4352 domain-containing protein n=1 Tax=Paenibacillus ferrarius TaxID=1469647 RepID=UPI001FC97D5B|nr:DUF4352 domain-containing protein [Paenibacillus ferrarius]
MKLFKSAAIALITTLVLTACVNGKQQEEKKDTSKTTVAKADQTKAPVPTPDQLLKEGTSSNVKITVESMESKEIVGDNELLRATANGVFKIIKLTVVNNQKDAITVDAASYKLYDDQKREFTSSSDAMMAVGMDKSFFLKKLNPGLSITGYVAYDVPKDAKGLYLKAQGGFTGKEIKLKVE